MIGLMISAVVFNSSYSFHCGMVNSPFETFVKNLIFSLIFCSLKNCGGSLQRYADTIK